MVDLHPLLRLELRRWRWRRLLGHWLGLYALSLALAAGLGGLWSGDSLYNGAGPRLTERWFFSFAVSQAPALAVWTAVAGVRALRRLARSGLLAHALACPLRPMGIVAGVGGAAAWPVALWLAGSTLFWAAVSLRVGTPQLPAVLFAHALLLAQAIAFGLLGTALAAASGEAPARAAVAVVLAGCAMAIAMTAMFAVGPLLERCARREWLICAVLLVNPAVAMGTALNLDVLRTPWIYSWTAIPAYRFAYPAPAWTLALYVAFAALAVCAASRRLRHGDEGTQGSRRS
jgi:hypothetical protein